MGDTDGSLRAVRLYRIALARRRRSERDRAPRSASRCHNRDLARSYTYVLRDEERTLDNARESPEQRQKRVDTRDRNRKREKQEKDEAVDGFDLRLVGEEQIDGMPVWVIDGSPKPGYKFKASETARFLSKVKGRIWMSESDYQPVRIDAETTGTVSFGAVLARVYKGTRIHVEYTYVNGEVWLPKRESYRVTGRLLLVKGVHQEGDNTYSNYKKFSADSA